MLSDDKQQLNISYTIDSFFIYVFRGHFTPKCRSPPFFILKKQNQRTEKEEYTMDKKDYYLYVKGKAVKVSEEVYKAYWKITEHEKYLQRKDWKYDVIPFSAMDYDGHFVDNIIDERIDLEKIVEVKMQIEELNKALATLTRKERELIEAIFYKEESLRSIGKKEKVSYQAIGKRRDKILEKLRKLLEDKF
ncbi:TPA: sigma-70 family RNA polymerase sigma factor [Streptococcus pneumoniae]